MSQIFNFGSGPATLPKKILEQIKKELFNWKNLGISVMEISHRSKEFLEEIVYTSKKDLRDLLKIPESYQILFCHGGARAQFSAVPMNLLKLSKIKNADYIKVGYWSNFAIEESKKYCNPNIVNILLQKEVNGFYSIKPIESWSISDCSSYIHYCPNETIEGISINEIPDLEGKIWVADFSSSILSCPLNIRKFGLIYASAQKNIGLSGITLVILRKDLLGYACKRIPSILNYTVLSKNHSIFNTPSIFSWYVVSLMFKWIKSKGGLMRMYHKSKIKSDLLYKTIDESDFYHNYVSPMYRSKINVPFELSNKKLNSLFLKEAKKFGLYYLQGHKSVGNMRASLYNAMPVKGVKALVNFMKFFEKTYG